MQFTQIFLSTLLAASSVMAAPVAAPEAAKSMMAASAQWTVESLKRVCDTENTSCTWTFGVDTGATTQKVSYVVKEDGDVGASNANGGPATFGDFTITSGWSGQFGEGNGFTTLSVVDNNLKQIIYPAYTDKQLADGKVVTPDQSYTPAALP